LRRPHPLPDSVLGHIMQNETDLPPIVHPANHQRARSVWFWLLVLAPAGLLLGILLLVGGGALFLVTAKEEPVTATERQLVVDAGKLSQCMEGFSPNPQYESITKTKYLDRSYDIEYQYDAPEDSDDPFIYCCLTVERKLNDAMTTYGIAWQTCKMMTWGADADVKYVDHNEVFNWGDKSRFAIIEVNAQPAGNLFVAREGTIVVEVMVLGVYFDAKEGFELFVQPTLNNIACQLP
jgi:hypothetical protein